MILSVPEVGTVAAENHTAKNSDADCILAKTSAG
jgi:hypothetical protein